MNTRRHPGYHRRRDMRLQWAAMRRQQWLDQLTTLGPALDVAQAMRHLVTPADLFDAAADADGQAQLLRTNLH